MYWDWDRRSAATSSSRAGVRPSVRPSASVHPTTRPSDLRPLLSRLRCLGEERRACVRRLSPEFACPDFAPRRKEQAARPPARATSFANHLSGKRAASTCRPTCALRPSPLLRSCRPPAAAAPRSTFLPLSLSTVPGAGIEAGKFLGDYHE